MATRLAFDPAFPFYCGLKWRPAAVVAELGLFPPFEAQPAWQSVPGGAMGTECC